jgi:integrase
MTCAGNNLYVEVMPNGSKYWRFRSREGGKETRLDLGEYPYLSLAEARKKRDEIKQHMMQGSTAKEVLKPKDIPTFEWIAREWHAKQIDGQSQKYAETTLRRLELFVFPRFGQRVVTEITAPEVLTLLRSIEAQGKIDTVHRVGQIIGRIFRYGISTGACEHDVTADLKGALTPNRRNHHQAALTDRKDIAELLVVMDSFQGSFIVKSALQFSAYSFLRPGEVRHLEWTEVDFEDRLIRLPERKMKARKPHLVPMSNQIVEVLEQLCPLTGSGQYVFPSNRTFNHGQRPMSENTVVAALRRLGYDKDQMSAHGFRGIASTLLYEQGWPSDAVERQLAHSVGSDVRQAYDYSQLLDKRREMMQAWADFLDSLKTKESGKNDLDKYVPGPEQIHGDSGARMHLNG